VPKFFLKEKAKSYDFGIGQIIFSIGRKKRVIFRKIESHVSWKR
jgi:hypothetical protein